MLFNRIATATIGESAQTGILVERLRMVFSVKKTDKQDSNICNLQIYNMKNETRAQIVKGYKLILRAGYVEDTGAVDLFIGDIGKVHTQYTGTDVVTNITAGDGEKALRESKTILSFDEGTNGLQIMEKVSKTFGLPLDGNFDLINSIKKAFSTGWSFAGLTRDALNELSESLGFNWSIQNDKLKVTEKGKGGGLTAYNLNKDTGLLGSPQWTEIEESENVKADKIDGWRIDSLLNPRFKPQETVIVKSRDIDNGRFRIKTVDHSGDTHFGQWTSTIQVVKL